MMSLLTPVRYPAKLYSHTDANAPQLASVDGAIKTILKACLVTGYGDKAGAGWTMLFEDATRIVLRAPDAQLHELPDIKIENGAGKYRVVSQDNPTAIDDATELASVPLLSRDRYLKNEWFLVATDVGFVFYYRAGQNDTSDMSTKGVLLYCALLQPLDNTQNPVFVVSKYDTVNASNGMAGSFLASIVYSSLQFINMRTGQALSSKQYLTLTNKDVDVACGLFLNNQQMMLLVSSTSYVNSIVSKKTLSGRELLKVDVRSYFHDSDRMIYIPTDYWEL